MNQISGTQVVEVWVKRKDAGDFLVPPVGERQVRKYLRLASIYLPSFGRFKNPELGGLNRYARLTNWDISVLQKIRSYVFHNGMKRLRIELSQNPSYFEEVLNENL